MPAGESVGMDAKTEGKVVGVTEGGEEKSSWYRNLPSLKITSLEM